MAQPLPIHRRGPEDKGRGNCPWDIATLFSTGRRWTNFSLFQLCESLNLRPSHLHFPVVFQKTSVRTVSLKCHFEPITVLFKEGRAVNMSLVYFWWHQGVSNQQRASASATDCKEKKASPTERSDFCRHKQASWGTGFLGSLEFHFHLLILLSLNTIRYLFTHKPFPAAFKKTINHLVVPSPFSVLLC